jgi:hypothetical protein
MPRLWGFPQLGIKLPRLFLSAMSRIDPMRAKRNNYFILAARGTPEPTQEAVSRLSDIKNFVRSARPLSDRFAATMD